MIQTNLTAAIDATDRISMKEAGAIYGVSEKSACRHCLHGVGGIRLKSFKFAGKRITTRSFVREFLAALNSADDAQGEPAVNSHRVAHEEQAAVAALV